MKNDPQRSRSSDPSWIGIVIFTALVSLFWLTAQKRSDQVWAQLEAQNTAQTELEEQRRLEREAYEIEELEREREIFGSFPEYNQHDTGDQ